MNSFIKKESLFRRVRRKERIGDCRRCRWCLSMSLTFVLRPLIIPFADFKWYSKYNSQIVVLRHVKSTNKYCVTYALGELRHFNLSIFVGVEIDWILWSSRRMSVRWRHMWVSKEITVISHSTNYCQLGAN